MVASHVNAQLHRREQCLLYSCENPFDFMKYHIQLRGDASQTPFGGPINMFAGLRATCLSRPRSDFSHFWNFQLFINFLLQKLNRLFLIQGSVRSVACVQAFSLMNVMMNNNRQKDKGKAQNVWKIRHHIYRYLFLNNQSQKLCTHPDLNPL